MGGKRRSKFERIYSDNESSSDEISEHEENVNISLDIDEDEVRQFDRENLNSSGKNTNSNSTSTNEKFLVTRSKRQYKKRELDLFKDKMSLKGNPKENNKRILAHSGTKPKTSKNSISEKTQSVSSKRGGNKGDTSDDEDILKARVEHAKSHLDELNYLIKLKNEEIEKLKSVKEPQTNNNKAETVVTPIVYDSDHDECVSWTGEGEEISDRVDDSQVCEKTERQDRKRESNVRRTNDEHHNKYRRSEVIKSPKGGHKSPRGRKRAANDNGNLEEHYRFDPLVQQIVKKMVSEQIEAEKKKKEPGMSVEKLKSPSDSTLYTPVINRAKNLDNIYKPVLNWNAGESYRKPSDFNRADERHLDSSQMEISTNNSVGENNTEMRVANNTINAERINDMISHLRLGMKDTTSKELDGHHHRTQRPSTSRDVNHQEEEKKRLAAEEAILEAERFKARVQQPANKGIQFNNDHTMCMQQQSVLKHMRYLDSEDDEFFHTVCHIDPNTREKIEKGGYVELDKLIQKRTQYEPSEKRMQLVNRDGQSYFVPYEKENKN